MLHVAKDSPVQVRNPHPEATFRLAYLSIRSITLCLMVINPRKIDNSPRSANPRDGDSLLAELLPYPKRMRLDWPEVCAQRGFATQVEYIAAMLRRGLFNGTDWKRARCDRTSFTSVSFAKNRERFFELCLT
jgi:hypothetical protein